MNRPTIITLRAIAYRAMTRIDLMRALALGELPAKSELKQKLKHWLANPQPHHVIQRLEEELKNLQKFPL